ncbi:MAG: M15 family metallopeptidase [Acutalibacteraceae bacterium]|nr:M15 family metallopeptidase [Acutalibacteraceae bacterium]
MNRRQKAILKRNIFLGFCALVLVALIGIIVFVVSAINRKTAEKPQKQDTSSIQSESSSDTSSTEEPEEPKTVQLGEYTLDATFNKLLLVNGENPLPDDYDYEANLTEIPQEYIKGSLTKIDKDVWVYLKAMLDNARKEGIDIGVWSPYRSYATQKMLFEKQVNKQIQNGVPKEQAEDKAATIVARPGTSEHHTGLALDINCANSSFEKTKAYEWLKQNAENYGFIMRYSEEKQSITGVIHESWHWRFVGINTAKKMNQLNMCLEEYLEYISKTSKH